MDTLQARLDLSRDNGFHLRVDTRIPLNGTTAIYGPSGSGKTTLLACLAGLLRAGGDSQVIFRDRDWQAADRFLPPPQRAVGYVFQDARLFPHLDVAGNLAFAHSRRHTDAGPDLEQVCHWLALNELLRRRPQELSSGQQQRVAIARALINAPRLLLLDEPLANIDRAGRHEILQHLASLKRELELPMIYVSHDMEELAQLADWLLVLERGAISAEGPMLELSSGLELAVTQREQAAAIVSAEVTGHDTEFGLTELALEGQTLYVAALAHAAIGSTRRLRIPARDVSLCLQPPRESSILNIFRTRLLEIETGSGSTALLRLQLGSQFLLARLTRKSIDALSLQPGDEVYAQLKSVALLNHPIE